MRVLIVEDDPRVRSSLDRALRANGYATEAATCGAEGLAMASGEPDAIVLDVNLPDISGFEVCRSIRRRGDGTRDRSDGEFAPAGGSFHGGGLLG